MYSFGARELSAKVAFVNTCVSFQSSFTRTSLCFLRPRRHISNGPHKHVRTFLDKQTDPNMCSDSISGGNGVRESSEHSQYNEEVLRDSATPSVPGVENMWYSVVERVGHSDERASIEAEETPTDSCTEPVVDLMKLDGVGQEMLTGSSYDTVVDVDIEQGGVLDDDEDNNDLHCGVELDALLESPVLVENLRRDLGIETATHVQLAAIPRVLDGKDIVIQSHTGTGKTLAFLLPILDEIDTTADTTQAVIIAPTRELAMQISRECDRLISGTKIRSLALIGGANPARQVMKLRKGQPHVVIGTPGRVAELNEQRELRTRDVRWLVVDEVDQCLGEAFRDHVIRLLKAVHRKQIILVSATSDVDRVRQFAAKNLYRPVLLRVGGSQRIPKCIRHYCCIVPARMKIELVKKLMNTTPSPKRAIAFVDDPRRVDIVVEKLYRMGLLSGGLKGNAHKLERADVMLALRKGRINLLVTTEVAARGLDVRDVTHIFNLDLPTDGDHYLHRAGRCGRAGEDGVVVSIASPDKGFVINRLASELGIEIPRMEPRHGMYSQPVVRNSKNAVRATGKRNNIVAQSDSREKERNLMAKKPQEAGSDGSLEGSLDSLRDALERGDAEYIERSFLKQVEEIGKSRNEDSDELRSSTKKTKKKLKGKFKTKAKAKANATEKAKVEAAERKAKLKAERAAEQELENNAVTRRERRNLHKRHKDLSYRAASEGWVGNRVSVKQDD